eukprot:119345_1
MPICLTQSLNHLRRQMSLYIAQRIDSFSTEASGNKYDRLAEETAQQLRQALSCYQIHAWIVDKEDEFKVVETVDDIDYDSTNYAGGAGIFGRVMECQNCVNRPPQDIVRYYFCIECIGCVM